MNWFKRFLHKFDRPCSECAQVRVPFWRTHCSFCDKDEGAMK